MYLLINLCVFLPVFILSFDKKVHFYTSFKSLFSAIIIIAIPFLIWDEWFTQMQVWGFTPRYLSGIYLGNLPLGELFFFLTVPYACIFIHACQIKYFNLSIPLKIVLGIIGIYLALYLLFANTAWGNYTLVNLLYFCVLCVVVVLTKSQHTLNSFFPSFLISLIPFLIVNGILTGSFLEEPIVWYNNSENMGIRIGTIPYEDILYSFNLIYSVYLVKHTLEKTK